MGEVINEALAEELQRDDLWTERDSRKTAATPAPQEMRETPIAPDPNPKRRLYRKSQLSAASSSGQQRVQCTSTDTEAETPTEAPMEIDADRRGALPSLMVTNTDHHPGRD